MKILLCAFVLAASMAFAESEGAKVLKMISDDFRKDMILVPEIFSVHSRGIQLNKII